MSRITWDDQGKRYFESGADRAVLFVKSSATSAVNGYGTGVPWNGFTGFTESPSGAEATALWANNAKYGSVLSAEDYGGTITSYTYPDEFKACDGRTEIGKGVTVGMQARTPFCFSYRTDVGNDTEGVEAGHIIHIVYNCQTKPSEKERKTRGEDVEALEFSHEITTTAVEVPNAKKSAYIEIDSRTCDADKYKQIEDKLYGSDSTESQVLFPSDIKEILDATA